jgi:putative ABC transport system permease protein
MEEEFAFHIEMEAGRLRAEGLSLEEARRQALARFGGLDRYREEMRDGRGARAIDDAIADVRVAGRILRRGPGAAIAIALTLGIGIGLNGFTYGIVDSMLFRPLPTRAPEQLVGVFPRNTRNGQIGNFAYTDYEDYRDKSGVFADAAGMMGVPLNLVVRGGEADMVWGEMVTENFFSVVDMQPAIGRFFTASDAPRGANAFAVLSYAAWHDRFAGDPGIIGRTIRVNGSEFTVTGVAPKGFKGLRTFGFWPEIWVPSGMHATVVPNTGGVLSGRGRGWLLMIARMHAGWDLDRTAAAASLFARQLAQEFPESNRDLGVVVLSARSGFDNPQVIKPQILVLASAMGMVGTVLVLMVICANLANLQLARAATRSREFAIRLSLGCSRWRLTKQLLVETVLVAVPGLMLAALIVWATPLIETVLVPRMQFRVGFGVVPNVRIALFTTIVAVCVVLVIGLIPAIRVARANPGPALANAVLRRRLWNRPVSVRGLLVIGQLALSVVLLVGGSLFTRTFLMTRDGDMGIDVSNRLLMSMNLGLQQYDNARGSRFYDQVLERVRSQSDVVSATWAFPVPFDTQDRWLGLYVDDTGDARDGGIRTNVSVVADDFVKALGLRLTMGRGIEARDSAEAPAVMVISRTLAERLSPTGSVLGKRVHLRSPTGRVVTVVGVVDDATFQALGDPNAARAYLPLRQHYSDWQTLVVHTRGAAMAPLPRIRDIVAAADPALPVFGVGTLDEAVSSAWSSLRIAALAAAVFGGLAVLIAAIGLYAVVASSVTERAREIGVRIALGSTPHRVMRHVMAQGFRLGAWGLVLGLAGAVAAARLMAQLLAGLSAFDVVTFAGVPVALFAVVLAATYIPARRAVKLEPTTALRTD